MDSHQKNLSNFQHTYSEASLNDLIKRLSRIEGHIRGVKNMVEDSRPCPDVLIQIAAVRGAVKQVGRIIGVAESKYESGDRWNKTCTSHRERH
ncbi:metal-sensitive transcriptional regulator [Komarekiella sp. 'clone 1']|uniref:Metal-sensitive transcriptional regulator n=1 Tax=Komarekiella delphini-convector SJRDD-AB1 TaxID=2593771 RepID=A0AA40T4L8_9NOST|nr:metal-sensitive transcriptional regulator [Komarekiella delphini-convector SJRDD-AB1]